ncbi:uncharacterized protein [Chlorocebus sabaeus]|uniref:uncharacterized protein isoform X2 n=1 Tax=Chlorocebus sabaeus TaxID=60711 RepID=UPI003BF95B3A
MRGGRPRGRGCMARGTGVGAQGSEGGGCRGPRPRGGEGRGARGRAGTGPGSAPAAPQGASFVPCTQGKGTDSEEQRQISGSLQVSGARDTGGLASAAGQGRARPGWAGLGGESRGPAWIWGLDLGPPRSRRRRAGRPGFKGAAAPPPPAPRGGGVGAGARDPDRLPQPRLGLCESPSVSARLISDGRGTRTWLLAELRRKSYNSLACNMGLEKGTQLEKLAVLPRL